jgi:hypothetical protein
MPRFSESLFESIRNFGRMSPTEGRRRALEQPTQYQQMGTTDPLARSLGKMFGGLGVDTSYMQTGEERAQAAMQKAGQQKFESPEARMIAMLEAQLPTLRPQAQMQAMGQIRQLRDIERQRAAAEAEQRKARGEEEKQQTVERGKQNLVRMASDPEFDFANPKQKAGYLSMARAYGVEPKDALELYDSLKPEAKKAVGSRAAPQKVEYINEAGEAVVGMSIMDPTTGEISVEEIGPVIPKESKTTEKDPFDKKWASDLLTETRNKARDARTNVETYSQLADEAANRAWYEVGAFGRGLSEVEEALGIAGASTVHRRRINEIRMSNALDLLPKGPASDKDVKLAMDASIDPNNLDNEQAESYLRGMAKIAEAEEEYYSLKSQYMQDAKDPNAVGFDDLVAKKSAERGLQKLRSLAPASVEAVIQKIVQANRLSNPAERQTAIQEIETLFPDAFKLISDLEAANDKWNDTVSRNPNLQGIF